MPIGIFIALINSHIGIMLLCPIIYYPFHSKIVKVKTNTLHVFCIFSLSKAELSAINFTFKKKCFLNLRYVFYVSVHWLLRYL